MSFATGVGSHPGDDARGYDEAVRVVFGELGEDQVPYLPELPGRGAAASMTGRTLAVVAELAADLQPSGWRLTGSWGAGVDQRRARSLLAQDLDAVEQRGQGFAGPFKVQVCGPWTLAATTQLPRGERVLSDHGARRELGEALAAGLTEHLAVVRRRLPGMTRLICQLDEPLLGAVLAARVPTASGYGRYRAIDLPEARSLLEEVTGAITEAGAQTWVHSCAADLPFGVLPPVTGLLVDPRLLDAEGIDALANHLDQQGTVVLGLLNSVAPESWSADGSDRAATDAALRWLDMVGFDPIEVSDRLGISASCGFAGATQPWARNTLGLASRVARNLSV